MNYFEAHKLLNEVKDGINHPTELITYALFLTGDLEIGDGSAGLDRQIQHNEIYSWPGSSSFMVGANDKRH